MKELFDRKLNVIGRGIISIDLNSPQYQFKSRENFGKRLYAVGRGVISTELRSPYYEKSSKK